MGITIQQFSLRTGLAPGTLRFYDKKKLLSPSGRLENGYRLYEENQIQDALLIQSLRQADISIHDIHLFLQAGTEEKLALTEQWRLIIEVKQSQLQIAKKYLSGMKNGDLQIYLIHWEKPSTIIWFTHNVPRREHPFKEYIHSDLEQLEQMGVPFNREIFTRINSAKGDQMNGEVGFRVESTQSLDNKIAKLESYTSKVTLESFTPMLFASMDCPISDDYVCFQFINLISKYGFTPTGRSMNRMVIGNDLSYRMMVPVLHTVNHS